MPALPSPAARNELCPGGMLRVADHDPATAALLMARADAHSHGSFVRRSADELWQQLERALGSARLASLREQAEHHDDAALFSRVLDAQRAASAAATASIAGSRPARQAS